MLAHYVFVPMLLLVPAIIGGVLHSLVIKTHTLSWLAVPIKSEWFGANKTWRGMLVMPLGCLIGEYVTIALEHLLPPTIRTGLQTLSHGELVICGLCLGLGYVLFELPNSWAKRRLGIAEGMLADDARLRHGFLFADQVDSVIGCLVVCWLFLGFGIPVLGMALVLGVAAHLLVNYSLYLGGIRSRPV
ncbi:MAG: CDP-archaeol synthase [Xanthomonadales bacterium]|nr:CDP-archaeol synthase [Xanthomonadales bacterium]